MDSYSFSHIDPADEPELECPENHDSENYEFDDDGGYYCKACVEGEE